MGDVGHQTTHSPQSTQTVNTIILIPTICAKCHNPLARDLQFKRDVGLAARRERLGCINGHSVYIEVEPPQSPLPSHNTRLDATDDMMLGQRRPRRTDQQGRTLCEICDKPILRHNNDRAYKLRRFHPGRCQDEGNIRRAQRAQELKRASAN